MTELTRAAPPRPLGRRERKKLEVRSRIYDAARELFKKQGFDATTVDEIAHVADEEAQPVVVELEPHVMLFEFVAAEYDQLGQR